MSSPLKMTEMRFVLSEKENKLEEFFFSKEIDFSQENNALFTQEKVGRV